MEFSIQFENRSILEHIFYSEITNLMNLSAEMLSDTNLAHTKFPGLYYSDRIIHIPVN